MPWEKLGIFPSLRTYMEKTVRTMTPRTSPPLVLHQQAKFKEEGKLRIFLRPTAYEEEIVRRVATHTSLRSVRRRRKLRIFLCPRAYMEGEGGIRIFLNARANMDETVRRVTPRTSLRSVFRQQTVFNGERS